MAQGTFDITQTDAQLQAILNKILTLVTSGSTAPLGFGYGVCETAGATTAKTVSMNNQEGGIFGTLPGMPDSPAIRAPHGECIIAWGGALFNSMQIARANEWAEALNMLLSAEPGPVLIEIYTETEQDAAILKDFYTNI